MLLLNVDLNVDSLAKYVRKVRLITLEPLKT